MKREIDFKKLEVLDVEQKVLEGEALENFIKNASQAFYERVKSMEMMEVCWKMRKLEVVKLNEDQAKEIKEHAKAIWPFYVSRSFTKLIDEEFEKPLPQKNK